MVGARSRDLGGGTGSIEPKPSSKVNGKSLTRRQPSCMIGTGSTASTLVAIPAMDRVSTRRCGEMQEVRSSPAMSTGAAMVPCAGAGVAREPGRAIVVAGDALVDFVLEPGGGTTPHLGGGSFNAARTLGRLGLRPVFIARLSTDRYGRALRLALEESGVRLDGIVADRRADDICAGRGRRVRRRQLSLLRRRDVVGRAPARRGPRGDAGHARRRSTSAGSASRSSPQASTITSLVARGGPRDAGPGRSELPGCDGADA